MPKHKILDMKSVDSGEVFKLLQLPEAALNLVLQKLDPRSLASTAASCVKLNHTVPGSLTKLVARWMVPEAYASFNLWMEQHSSSLAGVTQCSLRAAFWPPARGWLPPPLCHLPCPHLRELHLVGLTVQLEPAAGSPGVLHGCTDLTALHLEWCEVEDVGAAFAAIAALPELQSLQFQGIEQAGEFPIPELQHLSKLTQLSIACDHMTEEFSDESGHLSQLSALSRLESLHLSAFPPEGLPDGVPSQLSKLTHLSIEYCKGCDDAEQFRHLSTLTALQDLSVKSWTRASDNMPTILGHIQYLSQLTSLGLGFDQLQFCTSSTQNWTRLTALHSLSLQDCAVQPQALAALTQLRALSLDSVRALGSASFEDLMLAVSKLTLLKELVWDEAWRRVPAAELEVPTPPAAVCTALTASTNLCSLQVQAWRHYAPQGLVLFEPGTLYPNLRNALLHDAFGVAPSADSQQQLEQFCSSCPAIESLSFVWQNTPPTSCLPLLQLSALTHLTVHGWGDSAAVAAAVGVTAQLVGLKYLSLSHLPQLRDPTLLQLTALTALDELDLSSGNHDRLHLKNKARWCSPPDVGSQLLRHLLQDASCRQELLKRSCGAAAAPAERMLAQVAASLAEELAASSHG